MCPTVNSINTLQKTEELYTPYRATFCMPKISDYSYVKVQAINKNNNTRYDAMETVITFANGDKVTVSCPIEEANQYTGFYTAIAKYAMGNSNKVNNEADYWINKLPKQKAKTEAISRRVSSVGERCPFSIRLIAENETPDFFSSLRSVYPL